MVIKKELTPAEMRLKTNAVLKELLQVVPPMAPDSPTDESKSTEAFVVPDHLVSRERLIQTTRSR